MGRATPPPTDAPESGADASRAGVLITVAYDGTDFAGFARQRDVRTVQGDLDHAVHDVDPSASLVRGTSRTDAGVHALAHPVAFDTALDVPPRGWALALGARLADDVSVVKATRCLAGYDPRGHARKKTYRYVLLLSPVRDPFWRRRAWRIGDWLNHDAMATEARLLLGEHDFRAFRTSSDARPDTVRTIFRADVAHRADQRQLHVEIEGDRFMHRMVRIIVGTLVDVGRGRLPPGAIERAIERGDRSLLGITAPPDGLYLDRVELDADGTCAGQTGQDDWPDHSSTGLTRGGF